MIKFEFIPAKDKKDTANMLSITEQIVARLQCAEAGGSDNLLAIIKLEKLYGDYGLFYSRGMDGDVRLEMREEKDAYLKQQIEKERVERQKKTVEKDEKKAKVEPEKDTCDCGCGASVHVHAHVCDGYICTCEEGEKRVREKKAAVEVKAAKEGDVKDAKEGEVKVKKIKTVQVGPCLYCYRLCDHPVPVPGTSPRACDACDFCCPHELRLQSGKKIAFCTPNDPVEKQREWFAKYAPLTVEDSFGMNMARAGVTLEQAMCADFILPYSYSSVNRASKSYLARNEDGTLKMPVRVANTKDELRLKFKPFPLYPAQSEKDTAKVEYQSPRLNPIADSFLALWKGCLTKEQEMDVWAAARGIQEKLRPALVLDGDCGPVRCYIAFLKKMEGQAVPDNRSHVEHLKKLMTGEGETKSVGLCHDSVPARRAPADVGRPNGKLADVPVSPALLNEEVVNDLSISDRLDYRSLCAREIVADGVAPEKDVRELFAKFESSPLAAAVPKKAAEEEKPVPLSMKEHHDLGNKLFADAVAHATQAEKSFPQPVSYSTTDPSKVSYLARKEDGAPEEPLRFANAAEVDSYLLWKREANMAHPSLATNPTEDVKFPLASRFDTMPPLGSEAKSTMLEMTGERDTTLVATGIPDKPTLATAKVWTLKFTDMGKRLMKTMDHDSIGQSLCKFCNLFDDVFTAEKVVGVANLYTVTLRRSTPYLLAHSCEAQVKLDSVYWRPFKAGDSTDDVEYNAMVSYFRVAYKEAPTTQNSVEGMFRLVFRMEARLQ